MSKDPIRIILVDDHAVVRSGLSAFLLAYDDLELVGEASTGQAAIELCSKQNPDVVIMDLVMPGMDGASATKIIRQQCPDVQIIALTSFKEKDLVQRALKAGAISYLLKNVAANDLVEAIRAAHAGRGTLSPEATEALIQTDSPEQKTDYHLTEREKEVLDLMIEGLNNPEIAARLVVSRSTAKFHVSSILSKLGVTSRTEAVSMALQHHLIDQG